MKEKKAMRESRNKLTEKEMELARMLMSECNTTADVQSKGNTAQNQGS